MNNRIKILALGVKLLHRIVFSNPCKYEVDYYSCSAADRALKARGNDVRLLRWLDLPSLIRNVGRRAYDLVICEEIRFPAWAVTSPLADAFRSAKELILNPERHGHDIVPFFSGIPIAIVDLSDSSLVALRNRTLLNAATCYFKRELPVQAVTACMLTDKRVMHVRHALRQPGLSGCLHKLRPLSLGLPQEVERVIHELPSAASTAKDYDVFYAGTTPESVLRGERFLKQLHDLKGEGYRVFLPDTILPLRDYLEACARSWLVWSPQGFGWDCYRHYEAAAVGSIPVINYPNIERYAPMLHGVHALFYDPAGDGLRQTIVDALRDKEKLTRMSAHGRALVFEHHTHPKQLDYIVGECLAT